MYVAVFNGFRGAAIQVEFIAELLQTCYDYSNAFKSAPISFILEYFEPFTGASPRTTGVLSDDIPIFEEKRSHNVHCKE